MNSIITSVFAALLFFVLSPGMFLRFPKNGSKFTVTAIHAAIFGTLFFLLHKSVYRFVRQYEGLDNNDKPKVPTVTPPPK